MDNQTKEVSEVRMNPIQSFFEMVSNRIYRTSSAAYNRVKIYYASVVGESTVDESKVNYFQARSIMNASVITDENGNKYGENYVLAAAFAAPVVNSMTALMLANPPSVKPQDGAGFDDLSSSMQAWYKNNQSTIFDVISDSQSEGDGYLYIKDTFDADAVQFLPEYVEKIVNPNDYTDVIGYEVKSKKKQYDSRGNIITVEYKTIYRKTFPYKIVIKYQQGGDSTDLIVEVDGKQVSIPIKNPALYMETLSTVEDYADLFDTAGRFETRPLPIVPFHFKKKAQHVYGESVFRNLYVYFLNYHRIMDHMTRNVLFNLISLPFIKGVENVEQFLKNNGELDKTTGEYKLKLDPRKVIFGGKDFAMEMLEAPDTVESAKSALQVYFYLIVQGSETPEFFFGTAVQGSRASVQEQMPIVLNKGQRYQNIYTEQMINLFETVIYYKSRNGDVTVSPDVEIEFSWGSISLEDTDSIIKLVETMDSMGLITDDTKAKILGLSRYVSDISQEVQSAKQESDDRAISIDQSLANSSNDENNTQQDELIA